MARNTAAPAMMSDSEGPAICCWRAISAKRKLWVLRASVTRATNSTGSTTKAVIISRAEPTKA